MSKVTIGKLFKSSGMGACVLALLFTGSLFIIASGGGGGSSAPEETAVLNESNAEAAAEAVIQSFEMSGPVDTLDGGLPFGTTGGTHQVEPPLRSMVNRALGEYRTAVAKAEGKSLPFVQSDCLGGGTMDAPDLSEQDIINAAQSGSLTVTMSYDNCIEGTQMMDGAITLQVFGNFETQTITSMSFTTNYFRTADSDVPSDMTMTNYRMTANQLTFDGSDNLTAATFTVTGDTTGSLEGQAIDESFYNLAVRFENAGSGEYLSINGMLRNNCIGGWATVSTAERLYMPTGVDCPTEGDFSIRSGGNTVRVAVNVSGLIDIYFGSTLVVNDVDCNNISGFCLN